MNQLKRELGLFSCTMLVAGNMIGIGIFITAGRIYSTLPNPYYIFFAWVFGGLLSLIGALSYAELSTRFPRAGGGYVYLREAFGPLFGFLAGFSSSMVTLPGTTAFLAIGVTKYAGFTDPFIAKTTAVLLILSISYVNYRGVKWGSDLQNGFMLLKLSLIFILIFAGFLFGNGSFEHFSMAKELPHSFWVVFPLCLVPIMYTYSGWDATVYIAGEIKNPTRNIPLASFYGTAMVMIIYLSLAALYIYGIPVVQENQTRIVTSVSRILFGGPMGSIIGGMVAVSVLGALSATILTAPRVMYAMAQDGLFPAQAAEVHGTFYTPGKAIWFQCLWACLLALTGTFDQLLDYVTVPSVFFNAVVVVGLLKLRFQNKADVDAKPYLMLGYPILPILFIFGMGWIVVNTIVKAPKDSIWGLLIVSLGVPIYFIVKKYTLPRKNIEKN